MGRKHKRSQWDGFVAWSDAELDTILGDYTDLELPHGSNITDSMEIMKSANEPKSKQGRLFLFRVLCLPENYNWYPGHLKRKH